MIGAAGDTQDCLHGARYLGALDQVDRERIGIIGGSYGGYMVACCLAKRPRVPVRLRREQVR